MDVVSCGCLDIIHPYIHTSLIHGRNVVAPQSLRLALHFPFLCVSRDSPKFAPTNLSAITRFHSTLALLNQCSQIYKTVTRLSACGFSLREFVREEDFEVLARSLPCKYKDWRVLFYTHSTIECRHLELMVVSSGWINAPNLQMSNVP